MQKELIQPETHIDCIYLPGNVPSKKNSKVIYWKSGQMKGRVKAFSNGRPMVPFITSSKITSKYEQNSIEHFLKNKNRFKNEAVNYEKPLLLAFHFIRDSKRKFDFNNATQVILDMMQQYNWIEDDDCSSILPMPMFIAGEPYTVSKEKAGVLLKIVER